MYLHLGQSVVVPHKNILGIFDLDNTSVSKFTREFLRARQQEGTVVTVAEDIPKSFVLCATSGRRAPARAGKPARRETVYLSQLAASTLRRRAEGNGLDF